MRDLFRQKALEHRKYRLVGEICLAHPPHFKYLTYLVLAFTVTALTFLFTASYDRKSVVSGVIQPSKGVVKLSSPQDGLVSKILVSEGQIVKMGEPLIRVESQKYGMNGKNLSVFLLNKYEAQIILVNKRLTLLNEKKDFKKRELLAGKAILNSKLIQLDEKKESIQSREDINRKIIKKLSSLSKTGYVSDIELLKQEESLLALKEQKSTINSEILTTKEKIELNNINILKLPIDFSYNEDELNEKILEISSKIEIIRQETYSEIRSPFSGKVTGILAKLGKKASKDKNLLSILPLDSNLEAILYIPTSAYGFIQEGQPVKLRFHAFPYERFGLHTEFIHQISSNVILPNETEIPNIIQEPSYRVKVQLKLQHVLAYGQYLPLRPGMTLEADVILERQSLLKWLFNPLFRLSGKI